MLTKLKNEEETKWINEANSQSLQQTLRQLDNAYQRFFSGVSKFPSFKKKRSKASFTVPQNIDIKNNKIFIPKFKDSGGIAINLHRQIEGRICFATIKRTACGNYYCALTVEFSPTELPKTGSSVGIDLGIKDFAILSSGAKYQNPRYFVKSQKRLAFKQKRLSRIKNKQSKTYRFRRRCVAKLHEKVSNQRKDFLHKVSYEIVKNHDVICMESLNAKGMIRNHKLAKHIADVGWGYFGNFIKYKSEWYGKTKVEIDRFFPSSQVCSECGYRKTDLKLSDREWVCIECGCVHDRDVNAAKNIKNQGLQMSVSGIDSDSKRKQLEPSPSNINRKVLCVGEVLKVEVC
jgi:putative transposase